MIIKLAIAFICTVVISYFMGMLFAKKEDDFFQPLIYGFLFTLGGMEVISLPCIYFGVTFQVFFVISLLFCIATAVGAIFLHGKEVLLPFKNLLNLPRNLYFLMFVCLLLGQIGIWQVAYHTDEDDAMYVANATTTIDTNTLFEVDPYTGEAYEELPARYILSPFPFYTAFVSKMFGLRPLVVAHTFFPVWIILLSYGVIWLYSGWFFEDKKSRSIMMLFAAVLTIFSYYSARIASARLMLRPWQGKTVLASIVLPMILLLMLQYGKEVALKKREFLLLFVMMLAATFTSSMGIALSVVVLGCILLVQLCLNKNKKLFLQGVICCLPAVALSLIYLMIR